jgi:hypothetical protein
MVDWISRRQVRLMNESSEVQIPNPDGTYPIEPKVVAARVAAFVVSLLAAFLLKSFPVLSGILPEVANWAIEMITDLLLAGITFVAVWWAGWKAKHVQRPQAAGNAVLPEQ